MKPHRGTLILVFGIVSLVACAPFGIFAWIMGNNDMREIDSGLMDPTGRSNTSAGRVCGMIGSGLFVLQLAWCIFVLSMIFSFSRMHADPRVDFLPHNSKHAPTPNPSQR